MFHKRQPKAPASSERQRTPSGWHQEDWQSYDSVADEYERIVAPKHEPPGNDLVSLTGISVGDRVLDVGTGTGATASAALEAVGPEGLVAGIDPSSPMLRHARERVPGARLVIGEMLDLPFRSGTFDAVITGFVLSHLTRYETGLFDMVRVLRPGGRLGFANWGAMEDEFGRVWRGVAEELVGKELYRDAARRALPWQKHFADPDRIKETLKDAGLRLVEAERRTYRYRMSLEDYLAGQEARMIARSLHRIMGETIWERFRATVRERFAERFRDPIGDTREVWFGIGTRER